MVYCLCYEANPPVQDMHEPTGKRQVTIIRKRGVRGDEQAILSLVHPISRCRDFLQKKKRKKEKTKSPTKRSESKRQALGWKERVSSYSMDAPWRLFFALGSQVLMQVQVGSDKESA